MSVGDEGGAVGFAIVGRSEGDIDADDIDGDDIDDDALVGAEEDAAAEAESEELGTPTLSSREPALGPQAHKTVAITATARPVVPTLAAAVTAGTPRSFRVRRPRWISGRSARAARGSPLRRLEV